MGFGWLRNLLSAAAVRETHYIRLPSLIDSDDNMTLRGFEPLELYADAAGRSGKSLKIAYDTNRAPDVL